MRPATFTQIFNKSDTPVFFKGDSNALFFSPVMRGYISFGSLSFLPQIIGTNSLISENNYIGEQIRAKYNQAIKDWMDIVGKDQFFSLPAEKQSLLINTAGILDFEEPIDVYAAYKYSIY